MANKVKEFRTTRPALFREFAKMVPQKSTSAGTPYILTVGSKFCTTKPQSIRNEEIPTG